MGSLLFFIFFTISTQLYRVFPSFITVWRNAALVTFISCCLVNIKLTPSRPMYDERRTMGNRKLPYAYDMTGWVYFSLFAYFIAFMGELIIKPAHPVKFMWAVYAITLIFNYVVPTVIYLRWRIRFYLDVRDKADEHGWSLSANIFEFIFSGRRNVHNITVETQSGTQTIGILGGVGAMEYAIEDGKIRKKRTGPFDKQYALIDYGGWEKKEMHRWYRIKGRGIPLPEHTGKTYLMIQPNAFVISNNFLVDIGEEVEGMCLLNMETGMKVVHE